MSKQVTAVEVRRLLLAYGAALDAADSLPLFVRIASRSRRWTGFDLLRRLPRHTVGASTMVNHHVQRSTTALARRYDRIAATQGLTDDEKRASELVKTFRESLPAIRWKVIVPAALIAVLAAIQVLLGVIAPVTDELTGYLMSELTDKDIESTIDGLPEVASAFTPASFFDFINRVTELGPAGILALTATILAAGYLVGRLMLPAFRIKRIIFNLAPGGHIDLALTTTAWNAPRSVGLYTFERALFARLNTRAPKEFDLDIWVCAFPVVGFMWLALASIIPGMVAYIEVGDAALVGMSASLLGSVICMVAARTMWLVRTTRTRRRSVDPATPPAGFVPLGENCIVETRLVHETASLSILNVFMLPFVIAFLFFRPV